MFASAGVPAVSSHVQMIRTQRLWGFGVSGLRILDSEDKKDAKRMSQQSFPKTLIYFLSRCVRPSGKEISYELMDSISGSPKDISPV